MKIWPVILSGGSGSRLWPMSRAALPKQLLPLVSDKSLLQDTVLRIGAMPESGAPLIVCNNEHRFLIAEQLREIGVEPLGIYLEPAGRNTAPAAAIAALALLRHDPEAAMLLLPADHLIRKVDAFHAAIVECMKAVSAGHLATFGIVPGTPHTGYGYIRQGDALGGGGGSAQGSGFCRETRLRDRRPLPRRWRVFLEQRHIPVLGPPVSR